MILDSDLAYCRQSFEGADYPHYLVSLMMPASKRHALWSLGAFKQVIETIPQSVTEPALGYLRLTWWRDQVVKLTQENLIPGHPVLAALLKYIEPLETGLMIDFINEQESVVESPNAFFNSKIYSVLIKTSLGENYERYIKLENRVTELMKKSHGTRWESNPPFLAIRLWWYSSCLSCGLCR